MFRKIIVSFLFFFSTIEAHTPYQEKVFERIEKADELLRELNQQLEWFIKYKEACTSKDSELLKNQKALEKRKEQDELLKEKIMEKKLFFQQFREALSKTISLPFGDYDYQNALYSTAYLEVTKWYVKYLQDMLLPQGWEALYESEKLLINEEKPIRCKKSFLYGGEFFH